MLNEEHIVELNAFAYGGECVGRLGDGRAVFVPYVIPGETARVRLVEEKRGFARASLLEVLQPSEHRLAPLCPHFGDCGGCHYQHMDYSRQLQVKEGILREQLQRIAGIPNPRVDPMLASPLIWNYRNTAQFHLTPQGIPGFRAAGSHRVVEIRECRLLDSSVEDAWRCLDLEGGQGVVDSVEIRSTAEGDVLLVLHGAGEIPPQLTLDLPFSVVHIGAMGTIILAGDDHLVQEIMGRTFSVSAESFFQVNTLQAGGMVRHLLTHLIDLEKKSVLDVYCGVGLFSAFLAPQAGRVTGVESSPSACLDFAINLDEFEHVALYEGAAEDILLALADHSDVVVVDPPRTGLERATLDALAAMRPAQLAYVSCDPATLARDAKRLLAAGYQLAQVTPFDMFPHTFHIESISLFYPQ